MTKDQLSALTDLVLAEIGKRLLNGEEAWIVIARNVEDSARPGGEMEVIAGISSGAELLKFHYGEEGDRP